MKNVRMLNIEGKSLAEIYDNSFLLQYDVTRLNASITEKVPLHVLYKISHYLFMVYVFAFMYNLQVNAPHYTITQYSIAVEHPSIDDRGRPEEQVRVLHHQHLRPVSHPLDHRLSHISLLH